MRREDMEQLRHLKQELDTLERKYQHIPRYESLGDTYGDYKTGFKKIKVIQGVSSTRSEKLADRIHEKTLKLQEMIAKLEDYLDDVSDPFMRDVLRLYYAEGMTQEEVAERKHYSQQRIQQKIDGFWKGRNDL